MNQASDIRFHIDLSRFLVVFGCGKQEAAADSSLDMQANISEFIGVTACHNLVFILTERSNAGICYGIAVCVGDTCIQQYCAQSESGGSVDLQRFGDADKDFHAGITHQIAPMRKIVCFIAVGGTIYFADIESAI